MSLPGGTPTSIDAMLNALADGLAVRPGLAEVNIFTAAMPEPDAGLEYIQFWTVDGSQDWNALGAGRRLERYVVHGGIQVVIAGADEPGIRASRARLVVILGELMRTIWDDPTLGGLVRSIQLTGFQFSGWPDPDGRLAGVDFDLAVECALLHGTSPL